LSYPAAVGDAPFKQVDPMKDSKALQPFKDAAKGGSVIGLLVEAIKNSVGAESTRSKRKALESKLNDLPLQTTDMNIPYMGK
jgi:hypothetical protein